MMEKTRFVVPVTMTWDLKGTQLHVEVSETANEAKLRVALAAQSINLVSCREQAHRPGGPKLAIVEADPARVEDAGYLRETARDVMLLASMYRDHLPQSTAPEVPDLHEVTMEGTMRLPPWANNPQHRMFPGGPAIRGEND